VEAYRSAAAFGNGLVPPSYELPRWTYDQRARLFGALNEAWQHGRGQKRRQRRELVTQGILNWRRALLDGATELSLEHARRRRLLNSWRVLMHAPVAGREPAIYDLRAKVRARLDALVQHGPWSGWGVEDPHFGKERAHSYARYVVPKTSEKVWRWWRALALDLFRLVRLLDAWWFRLCPDDAARADEEAREKGGSPTKVVPPHHQAVGEKQREEKESTSTARVEDEGKECRDHVPLELRELLRRYPPSKGA
jgi:hypothetical protein